MKTILELAASKAYLTNQEVVATLVIYRRDNHLIRGKKASMKTFREVAALVVASSVFTNQTELASKVSNHLVQTLRQIVGFQKDSAALGLEIKDSMKIIIKTTLWNKR